MADGKTIPGTLVQAIMRAGGGTLPQDFLGGVQYAKNLVTHPIDTARSTRLDPDSGALIYNSADAGGPAAAMGRFVQMNPAAGDDPDVLKHELRHVAQSEVTGPLYLPMALYEALGGEKGYGGGPLENDAIRHATPQATDLLQKGDQDSLVRSLLIKLLGK